MKKSNERQPILPNISTFRTQQKPIKDILKDLKQKKAIIQSRIKTQIQQKQMHQQQSAQNQVHLRQRIITQVPYYINRNTYYNRINNGFNSHDQLSYHKIQEKQQKYQEEQNRQSNNATQHRKKTSTLSPLVNQQKTQIYPVKSRKQILRQIQQIFVGVPVDPRERTQQNIQQLKQCLMDNNMFFAKIHNVIATCLLKLNRLMWLQKNQMLYRIGEQRSSFYVILCGRVKIYDHDKNLKKICSAGESIAQQLLFSNSKTKKSVKQSAKAISRCFLVQIKTQNYKKMAEQMIRYGYKTIFNQMESVLKRNFITKNWLRGEKERFQKRH